MKKLVYVMVCLLLILVLTSCDIGQINIQFDADLENANLNIGIPDDDKSEPSSDKDQSDKTNEEDDSDNTSEEDKSDNTSEEDQTSDENKDTENDQSNQDNNNTAALENVNNGVLKDASAETMNVPVNIKLLGTEDITEDNNAEKSKATVVLYTLDGDVVNWLTENDLIYVITTGNNRLVVIDTKNMCAVANAPLAGKPAEINIVDDKIYISLPDLCRIDVFSKTDCVKEDSLYFDHEVSSFCLDGDYIYYSEHDQHCRVFRKNLTTDELIQIGRSFYFPKLYLNREDRILCIGESGSTGSGIYYYDADTLVQKSMFKKNDYGVSNNTREIFHIGDEIFWANYRLSDTNAKELVGRYGTAEYGSMTFASEDVVSTSEGLFLTDTYECIVNYFDAGFNFEYILVSESYNVFFRQRSFDNNIILGVNFELQ